MRSTAGAAALVAVVLGLAGCGGGYGGSSAGSGSSSAAGSGSSSAEGGSGGATLRTADSDLGEIVVDADGKTVYVFDKDEPGAGKSNCSGKCTDNWPPVVADSPEPTADGVDGDLATIERDDGTLQVTLDGSPLYLFTGDGGPGDVTGQAVQDVWWVVGPDGKKITEAPAGGADFSY